MIIDYNYHYSNSVIIIVIIEKLENLLAMGRKGWTEHSIENADIVIKFGIDSSI